MLKNTTKCNKTQSKWCINKHGASKIIDTFETYHLPKSGLLPIFFGTHILTPPTNIWVRVDTILVRCHIGKDIPGNKQLPAWKYPVSSPPSSTTLPTTSAVSWLAWHHRPPPKPGAAYIWLQVAVVPSPIEPTAARSSTNFPCPLTPLPPRAW
jgi:hypothetical protein